MDPDDHVCLCFRVSLRTLRRFMRQTSPVVPSQLSECCGAGTGCHWCVPFLTQLHAQWRAGELPDLPISPAEYAQRRAVYRQGGRGGNTGGDDDSAGAPRGASPSGQQLAPETPAPRSAESGPPPAPGDLAPGGEIRRS